MKTLLYSGAGAVLAAGLVLHASARPGTSAPTASSASVSPATGLPANSAVVAVSSDGSSASVSTGGNAVTTAMLIRQQKDTTKTQREAVQLQEEAAAEAGKSSQNAYNVIAKLHATAPARLERALVIRASKTDPKTIAAMEEDLRVMSRILHKALHESGDDGAQRAMGINTYAFSESSRPRNIQIEGFGAIFLLHVNFPLVGPEAKAEETTPKEATNSTWEEARREIYGRGDERLASPTLVSYSTRVKFDPKRVDKLKAGLLEAIKNAANIRHLAPDETVTVVVNSGDSTGGWEESLATFSVWEKTFTDQDAKDGATPHIVNPFVYDSRTDATPQSTMTIRAKKSDIDAFAKGKITADEFHKKASVLIY